MSIHVGDIGTVFTVAITEGGTAVDVSSAAAKHILFGKPNGTSIVKEASFATTGADGILTYKTIDGDLSMAGAWSLQAKVALAGGTWYSDTVPFTVVGNVF